MADIVTFNPNQYLKSVNTSDYTESSNVLINPDVSAVKSVPLKYWKKGTGNEVAEMSIAEKALVDSSELQIRKDGADTFDVGLVDIFTALIKVINIRLPSGQKITRQELINAVKLEVT